MDALAVVLVLVAVVATAVVVGMPLQAGRAERSDALDVSRIADLEAAKEARYREIREAEMDFRTGKLSEADWRTIDRQLRAEAMELLRRLDALGAGPPPASARSRADRDAEPSPAPVAPNER
jgi:hypothetical protein